MKKLILVCGMGALLSGCTVATVQTRTVYSPAYPQYSTVYTNPYAHYPTYYQRCYNTYYYNYYGAYPGRRVCR